MRKTTAEIEIEIATKVITDALAAGFCIDVNDGEDTTVQASTDQRVILDAMRSTDEDFLILHKVDGDKALNGWVRFVYGNGDAVISDYTVNLEDVLKGANALAESLEGAEA
jgi:hypothetical protein